MFNYYIEMSDRCGELLAMSRTQAKLSRSKMSREIGVSESTIKAWEVGEGSPTLPVLVEWFRITGCNPFRYMLDFFWPEYFQNLTYECSEDKIRQAIQFYISNVAYKSEIEKLHYLVFNDFGGDWKGILDMISAHASVSLNSRYRIAEIILTSYELSVANNTARVLTDIKLNRNLLMYAINEAKSAIMIHKNGYSVGACDMNISELASKILSRSRVDSGKTQLYMAKAMGKSERTIQNWESTGEPSFLEICYWLHILDKNFWDYASDVLYHNESTGTDKMNQELREDLQQYFIKADIKELRKLCHLIVGGYGSYWNAVLEMMMAHVCTPLYQRVMTARTILISYELDSNENSSQKIDHILPDIDNLKRCIDLATAAAKEGKNFYRL